MAPNGVKIGDVYNIVEKRFDKLEKKLDTYCVKIDEQLEKKDEANGLLFKDLGTRTTALEKFRDRALFIWAIVVIVVKIGYDYIKSKFF